MGEEKRLSRKCGLRQLWATWKSLEQLNPHTPYARINSKYGKNLNIFLKSEITEVLEEFNYNLRTRKDFSAYDTKLENHKRRDW